jgi:flagellar assembly factor FliW
MRIDTQRFGTLNLSSEQLFLFPQGLIGMETLRQWALLPDPNNATVAWLQSASRGDRAIAVISPRAFFDDYRVHVTRRDLTGLNLQPGSEVYILTAVSGHVGKLTTNLRSPFLLNLNRRLGCQIITSTEYPIQQPLPLATTAVQQGVAPQRAAARQPAAFSAIRRAA